MKDQDPAMEPRLRVITMNEDQWRLHKNTIIARYPVLFIGLPEQGRWLPEAWQSDLRNTALPMAGPAGMPSSPSMKRH